MKIETEPPTKDLEIYKEQIDHHKVNTVAYSVLYCSKVVIKILTYLIISQILPCN